jgi:peptide/nickel transport system ATP-binding protein
MQQRILIAIAIGLNPKILIADEPTTGLDPVTKLHILNLIRSLKEEQGMAILFISHDLRAISYVAENMGIINDGRLIETGSVTEILTFPQEVYTRELVGTIDLIG